MSEIAGFTKCDVTLQSLSDDVPLRTYLSDPKCRRAVESLVCEILTDVRLSLP